MQIIVKLTTACNLNCVYCSEGDKPMQNLPIELLQKLIDELPPLLDKYHDDEVSLLWHGGEPMLAGREYLSRAMDYAGEKLQKYRLSFSMQTNGTLIDAEWIDLFKKYDVGVGISLDGYKSLHDANRLDKQGKPTFNIVMRNIQKMKDSGRSVGTLMVLNTKEEINVDALFDFIKENRLNPKIHPVIPCGRAKENDTTDEIYENYVSLMIKLYEKLIDDSDDITVEPLEQIMNAILGIAGIRECSFNGSCGQKFICLYANGCAGFCGRSEYEGSEYSYGNLKDKTLTELYESASAEKIRARQAYLKEHDCKNCEDWTLCHGGCAFEAVNAFDTLKHRYPSCIERKVLLKYLKTTGLELLKQRLLRQKRKYRMMIKERKRILKELEDARTARQ